jgi:hypothetical protein
MHPTLHSSVQEKILSFPSNPTNISFRYTGYMLWIHQLMHYQNLYTANSKNKANLSNSAEHVLSHGIPYRNLIIALIAKWNPIRKNNRSINFFLALQPSAGYGLLVLEAFVIPHNDAPQSVGFLWTSEQLVAETST